MVYKNGDEFTRGSGDEFTRPVEMMTRSPGDEIDR